jgi:hypothetical protein
MAPFPMRFSIPTCGSPTKVAVAFPMHAEVGQTVVGTLDASLAAYFSGAWGGSDIASLLTAGAGVWVSRCAGSA